MPVRAFLVGANYVPATAINQLEMWQADTFDPARIDLELGWADGIGMNTMRVFLHDLAYKQDPRGLPEPRRPVPGHRREAPHPPDVRPVRFGWDPFPATGQQRPPRPGVHNSGWVQSPGKVALEDPTEWPRLEGYVKAVVGRFRDDPRVLAWDLWNEPDNTNEPAYASLEPKNKAELVACAAAAGLRLGARGRPDPAADERPVARRRLVEAHELPAIDRLQLALSDVVTFHSYDPPAQLEARIRQLLPYNRPIVCTEYMARGNGSTFEGSLPVLKKHGIGAINWGLVAGQGADAPAVGLMAPALRRPRARGLVPRGLPQRRHALRREGDCADQDLHGSRRSHGRLTSTRRERRCRVRTATEDQTPLRIPTQWSDAACRSQSPVRMREQAAGR